MSNIIIALDIILILTSFWMIYVVRQSQLGGVLGTTLQAVVLGALLLGLAHAAETIMIEVLSIGIEITELTHRLMVLVGFALLIFGFQRLAQLRNA